MKVIRCFPAIILFMALLSASVLADRPCPSVSGECVILVEPVSGTVLYEKNANETHLIASTTKLMTALVCAENTDPAFSVTVKPEWTRVEGSSMYLQEGESYTYRELLTGLLLASGNNAALAIADSVFGDPVRFTDEMNRKAMQLGMESSHFVNPHGLNDSEHYSTAGDLSKLMKAVLRNEEVSALLSLREAEIHGCRYMNHNKLLLQCEGMLGGKTGYTKAAGRCLVSACERNGMTLICVTLNDPDDWTDHRALYDWAFAEYTVFTLDAETVVSRIPVIGFKYESAPVCPMETVSLCIARDAELQIEITGCPFVFSPVLPGERIGTGTVLLAGKNAEEFPLVIR